MTQQTLEVAATEWALTGSCITVFSSLPVASSEWLLQKISKEYLRYYGTEKYLCNSKTYTYVQLRILMRSLDILVQSNAS